MQEATFNKLPPQDLDAERSVIGSILLFGECLDDVAGVINVDDFYLDSHREMFRAIQHLQTGVDTLTVAAELERRGKLEEVGGNTYLIKVMESVPHAAHAVFHARIVREKSLLRKTIYAATQTLRDAYDSNARAAEVLGAWSNEVYGLLEAQTTHAESISGIGLRSMDRLTSPHQEGLPLGFTELDAMIYGAKPGQVIIVGALSGAGKSAFACNTVRKVSEKTGVLFCSIEMTGEELHDRLLVSDLGVGLAELRPMARNDYSRSAVTEGINKIGTLRLIIDSSTEQSLASIASQARLARRKMELGLIVVDYLQIVTPPNMRDSREQQVAAISRGLSRIAKNLNVPLIALAQLNNESVKRVDKKPRLSDLRESAAIVQNANVVLLLDQPAQWDADKYDEHEAVLYVAKNRAGAKGRIDLHWDSRTMTFRDRSAVPDFSVDDVDFGP